MRSIQNLPRSQTPLGATVHAVLFSSRPFSSSEPDDVRGSAGLGRGRGRGSVTPFSVPDFSSSSPPPPPPPPRVPNASVSGRGRGRGGDSQEPLRSSSIPPSFASFLASPSLGGLPSAGRGRGRAVVQALTEPGGVQQPVKPIFFRRDEQTPVVSVQQRPVDLSFGIASAGRGKERIGSEGPSVPTAAAAGGNRHLRQRPVGDVSPATRGRGRSRGGRGRGAGVQSDGQVGSGRGLVAAGRGEPGRGRGDVYARARGGRGGRMGRLRPREESQVKGLYLGNDADGKKLTRRLGEDGAAELQEALEEASYKVLPCPLEDAYQDAVNMNYRIEFEPEFVMEEFGTNPDVDEKPPMLLLDALQKMKPFLMEYGGIQTEEEWEEVVKDTMEKSPYLKAIVDEYGGPDRVTAQQQQQELQRVAKTIPKNAPFSVNRFTERALLSLQSNPGWGFNKKCKFMDKLAALMGEHYK